VKLRLFQATSAALALLVPALAAAEPVLLRFSHVVAVDTPKGQAAEFFRRRVEELAGDRVRVEVHPNGTLYRDKDELEALQLGAVQMLAPSLSKLGVLGLTQFEVFDLPFIFAGDAELRAVTEGRVGRKLLDALEAKGIRGLAYWDSGWKAFSANRPLRSPADYRGLTMRVQSSMVLDAQMRALGANPLVTGFSDVLPALKAGIVDGTENPISNFTSQRMHEVQRHVSLTRHGYLGYAVIVNKRFWDGLPADVRRVLAAALRDATAFEIRIAKEKDEEDLASLRAAGTTEVHTPTPAERSALKKALLPVHERMSVRLGPQLIREIYAATGFDPEKP
jgi:C4-dicarboxylate-binding protein DctP